MSTDTGCWVPTVGEQSLVAQVLVELLAAGASVGLPPIRWVVSEARLEVVGMVTDCVPADQREAVWRGWADVAGIGDRTSRLGWPETVELESVVRRRGVTVRVLATVPADEEDG